MKKRILITGSTGFIGGHFLSSYKENYDFTPVHLRHQPVQNIRISNIDCILHFAALVHQMAGAPEEEYFKVNYELTRSLADKAKASGVKHFVYLSTAHVFGDSGTLFKKTVTLNETSPCQPQDAYGKSKLAAEVYLLSIQDENFKVAIIRPPMVYGPGAKGNILALAKIVNLLPILPFGYNSNKRSVVSVLNLCHFIKLAVDQMTSGILLPQDPHPVSLKELTKALAFALHKKRLLFSLPDFVLSICYKISAKNTVRLFGSLAFNNDSSKRQLNYTPPFTTTEGLERMFNKSPKA